MAAPVRRAPRQQTAAVFTTRPSLDAMVDSPHHNPFSTLSAVPKGLRLVVLGPTKVIDQVGGRAKRQHS